MKDSKVVWSVDASDYLKGLQSKSAARFPKKIIRQKGRKKSKKIWVLGGQSKGACPNVRKKGEKNWQKKLLRHIALKKSKHDCHFWALNSTWLPHPID